MYAVVVHGGAGKWRPAQVPLALSGVTEAARLAADQLARDACALDAVIAAVTSMEDNPLFNAGTGSVLNVDGEVEMDASVMLGNELRAGGVACLKRVSNPVQVARRVLEASDHVLLAGEGALHFARARGFNDYDPSTPGAREQWRERHRRGQDPAAQTSTKDTVGAVALDASGQLAAATSTGGVSGKHAGRVGDTPIPGAGNYATPRAAVSATGQGELMLRFVTAKALCDAIAQGACVQAAVDATVQRMAVEVGTDVGLIALDRHGNIGVGHGTSAMAHAFASYGQPSAVARIRAHG